MKTSIYIIIISILLICHSCEKNVNTWEWHNMVQFENYNNGILTDSTLYSFGLDETNIRDTFVTVNINLIGLLDVDKDRKINIKVENIMPEIKFGEHFSFNPDTCYIRKTKTSLSLRIKIKRFDELKHKYAKFAIKIMENSFFKTTNEKQLTNGENINMLRHKIIFSDMIERPISWKNNDHYFGKFSVKKFLLIVEVTNIRRKMFNDESYMTVSRKNYIKTEMFRFLESYKKKYKNNPEALKKIQEEDGTFITL